MRIMLTAGGAALIAMLAGCEDPEPVRENAVEVPGPGAYQNELQAMPDSARNAVFIRAILDAGRDCQHVDSSSYIGEETAADGQAFPVWEAQCQGGAAYRIMIQNNGVASVVEAGAAPAVGIAPGTEPAAPADAAQPQQ